MHYHSFSEGDMIGKWSRTTFDIFTIILIQAYMRQAATDLFDTTIHDTLSNIFSIDDDAQHHNFDTTSIHNNTQICLTQIFMTHTAKYLFDTSKHDDTQHIV